MTWTLLILILGIGIDIGADYSSIAISRDDGIEIIPDEHGCRRIPSSHLITTPCAGQADDDINSVSDQTSIRMLRRLKTLAETYLCHPVQDAVITVPACYGDIQRYATKEAGKSAGWNILRLLNAPTSATISHRMDNRTDAEHYVLALSLGARQAEVTLLELWDCAFEEKATASDTRVGGRSYDEQLCQHFAIQYRQHSLLSREACEQAKITLSVARTAQLGGGIITRDEFEDICHDLFRSIICLVEQVLGDANVHKASVKEVVLAGGSSRIPKLQKMISDFFGIRTSHLSFPDMACVQGAALYAASQIGAYVPHYGDFILALGVIPYTVSVELRHGFSLEIIPRCTVVPHRSMSVFRFNSCGGFSQRLQLFDTHLNEKNVLGTFDLSPLQFQLDPNQEHELQLSVEVNPDGIMQASLLVKNRSTGILVILPLERKPVHYTCCNPIREQHIVGHQGKNKVLQQLVQSYLSVVKSLCKSHRPGEQLVLKGAISHAENWMQEHKQDDNDDGKEVVEQLVR